MIKLKRPIQPVAFKKKADIATKKLEKRWQDIQAHNAQQLPDQHKKLSDSDLNGDIWRKAKDAFRISQSNKCAYCESKLHESDPVEHYRPKLAWQQKRRLSLNRPGYFWLAYEWNNFLLSCGRCNAQSKKGNLFPLADPTSRATPSQRDLSKEAPQLLNPYDDDPADHLNWSADVIFSVSGSGRVTMEVLELDEPEFALCENRRAKFKEMERCLEFYESGCMLPSGLRESIREFLLDSITPGAQFSGMVEANFGERIRAL